MNDEAPLGDETSWYIDRAEDEAFWKSHDKLWEIYQFAMERSIAPWSVLGSLCARVAANISPIVKLPAIIGADPASLNFLAVLYGPPGSAKSTSIGAGRRLVAARDEEEHTHDGWPMRIESFPLGSGEGLVDIFMRFDKESDDGTQIRDRAVIEVSEVDKLTALATRNGSTIETTLRHAAMGETIGSQNRDKTRNMKAQAGTYRLALVLGVQPDRADFLLGSGGGGLLQRLVWFPAVYPWFPDGELEEFPVPEIAVPGTLANPERELLITVTPAVRKLMRDTHRARQRGETVEYGEHELLFRAKLAAFLGVIVAGDADVTNEMWELSELPMRLSRAVLDEAAWERASKRQGAAAAKGEDNAIARDTEESLHAQAIERVGNILMRRAGRNDTVTYRTLKDGVAGRDKHLFREALDLALEDGRLIRNGDGTYSEGDSGE